MDPSIQILDGGNLEWMDWLLRVLNFVMGLFPYFADTTERGDRGGKAEEIGGERDGDFTDNSCNGLPISLLWGYHWKRG